MKFKSIFLFILVITLFACNQNTQKQKQTQLTKSEKSSSNQADKHSSVVATSVLNVEINGMVCEMGCGSAIRKELYKTDAVKQVDFDFKMGRDVNTAKVYFDNSKLSEEEILKILTNINNNQFTLGNKEVTSISENKQVEESTTNASVPVNTAISISKNNSIFSFEMPNLIDLFLGSLLR